MIVVVADTSGLVAALDPTHPDGDGARATLDRAGTVVISRALLAELDHVTSRVLGRRAALRAIDDVRRRVRQGRAVLPAVDVAVLDDAQAVRERHRDLELDLADAVNVVVAARFDTDAILTLDHRDLRTVHPLSRHAAFRLLPGDGTG